MFCPICKAEYREGFQICDDCNVSLVEELPPDPETEFVPVSTAKNSDLYHILAHEKPVIHTLGE